jgi:hypothetical protein
MEPITWLIIFFVIFAVSRAILRFRDGKMKLYEFFFWMLLWVGFLMIILFRNFIDAVQSFFGIDPRSGVLSLIAIVLLFYLLFRLYVRVEQQEKVITDLVRKSSIAEGMKLSKRKHK